MKKTKQSRSKVGKLLEISPAGTGFIEDAITGARYGFHFSMLRPSVSKDDAGRLDGQEVKFELSQGGIITGVTSDFASHP